MKKRKGFWFTVGSWIVENLIFRGYHLAKNPPKTGPGSRRKAAETLPAQNYPAAGE